MRNPTDDDFAALDVWGLQKDPFRPFKDYSDLKNELRWLNPQNREAHWAYVQRREAWIAGKNFDSYYREARKPIERDKWLFLQRRKAWYTPPVGWDRFADDGVMQILDLGCGDGDVTQRVIDHIVRLWAGRGYPGHKLAVIGVDLNESRVLNARELVRSPHPLISATFEVGDAVTGQLAYPAGSFDYVLNTGVLEILEDGPASAMLDEIARLSSRGIYIEDIVDHYPGGYPRNHLPEWLARRGFGKVDRRFLFSEPFTVEGSLDPMQLWPILKEQVIFAER
jgi:SAM-dependent methyltransferase